MPIVRIEHAVPDYEKWKATFDRDPADRKGSGVRRYSILRSQDDPNYVLIDLEFDEGAAASAFVDKMKTIWVGPAKSVMIGPRVRIADVVESKTV